MSPECRQFEIDLAAYLEGEPLPEIARHAEACPFCSVVLTDLELLRSESRSLPLEEPPARVWANVRAQLAAEGVIREQVSWRRWFSLGNLQHAAAPLGALACLAIFGAVLLVPTSSRRRATRLQARELHGPASGDLQHFGHGRLDRERCDGDVERERHRRGSL